MKCRSIRNDDTNILPILCIRIKLHPPFRLISYWKILYFDFS